MYPKPLFGAAPTFGPVPPFAPQLIVAGPITGAPVTPSPTTGSRSPFRIASFTGQRAPTLQSAVFGSLSASPVELSANRRLFAFDRSPDAPIAEKLRLPDVLGSPSS